MKKISLVVPMYYEEKVVNECYQRLTSVLQALENYEYEIIFINDGSKDRTLELLEEIARTDNKVKILSFARNFRSSMCSDSRVETCIWRCSSNNRC